MHRFRKEQWCRFSIHRNIIYLTDGGDKCVAFYSKSDIYLLILWTGSTGVTLCLVLHKHAKGKLNVYSFLRSLYLGTLKLPHMSFSVDDPQSWQPPFHIRFFDVICFDYRKTIQHHDQIIDFGIHICSIIFPIQFSSAFLRTPPSRQTCSCTT